jgi:hypothetical protein
MASSSKCTGSSLASARGLRWWQVVVACADFQSLAEAESIVAVDLARSIPAAAIEGNEKNLRVSASIYKPTSTTTAAERISSSG